LQQQYRVLYYMQSHGKNRVIFWLKTAVTVTLNDNKKPWFHFHFSLP